MVKEIDREGPSLKLEYLINGGWIIILASDKIWEICDNWVLIQVLMFNPDSFQNNF